MMFLLKLAMIPDKRHGGEDVSRCERLQRPPRAEPWPERARVEQRASARKNNPVLIKIQSDFPKRVTVRKRSTKRGEQVRVPDADR